MTRVVLAVLACSAIASAHGFDPALLELREVARGRYAVAWRGAAPGLTPVFPPGCRLAGDATLLECDGDLRGATVSVQGLARARTDVVWRFTPVDGASATGVLRADAPSFVVPTKRPHRAARSFFGLGVIHILGGADHLLFLVGLLLLVGIRRGTWPLVRTVTAFTVAHSLTLALAVRGVIALPAAPVEALIALSILYLALELLHPERPRRPWLVAFGFGLLHGLGFAGALVEHGLSPRDVPLALLAFNGGVEVGQLAFLAAAIVAHRMASRLLARVPPLAPAYLIGSLSAFWTIERACALFALALVVGCSGPPARQPEPYRETRPACADRDPLRRALFGDLHVHTSLSFDAYTWGTRATPADAYRFARGGELLLPPLDKEGRPTVPVKLARPLDFAAVTDHSEYLGETSLCITPGTAAYDSKTCQDYRGRGDFLGFGVGAPNPPRAPFCTGTLCVDAAQPIWKGIQDAAEAAYDRTAACAFTSFVAYEYTLSPWGSNMHRNVIFRSHRTLPSPITYYDAPEPADLWRELKAKCTGSDTGCDALAIPHNSNISNGRLFTIEVPDGASTDEKKRLASLRAEMEPLVEISQHKGDSECMNGIAAVLGAPDELCDHEKVAPKPFKECKPGTVGYGGFLGGGCVSWVDFVRNALKAGLIEEAAVGVNPLRLGVIGSTDTHNGTAGRVDERDFRGHVGVSDDEPAELLQGQVLSQRPLISNPGGLAGVWAEENTRDAIFDALRRRETFATSGPRIAVRLFAGWSYPADLCSDAAMVKRAYDGGVPMGGVLAKRPDGAAAPRFVVAALRDASGAPLQRAQIVKGWIDAGGAAHEQVYDVAGAKNDAGVDLATCSPRGAGADSLCAVWTDPGFNAAERAFYYLRVVENPTCRWQAHLCNSLTPQQRKELGCDTTEVPKTIQERAWSSPIWYSP